jgi:hypothetical protein
MHERILFFPIAAASALIAWYVGFGYVGLGILVGIAVPLFGLIRGENIYYKFETGAVLSAIGAGCYIGALYLSRKHGMSFEELDAARSLPKFLRRLPYYGIVFSISGIVVMVFDVLGRRNDRSYE